MVVVVNLKMYKISLLFLIFFNYFSPSERLNCPIGLILVEAMALSSSISFMLSVSLYVCKDTSSKGMVIVKIIHNPIIFT